MKTLVINLPLRKERLQIFKEHWSWLEPIERIDGILSDIPHTGCGLAHIQAIQKGLTAHEWCLVLEDDARLNCSIEEFISYISEATKILSWDAVFLGANSHKYFLEPEVVEKVSDRFFQSSRTKSLRSCTAMLWSRNALPLLNQYESILKMNYCFPIDRMLTSFLYPWECSTDSIWDEQHNSFQITPLPRVWISNKCLVYQEPGLFSDNTLCASKDYLKDSSIYLYYLFNKSKKDLQEQSPQQ